MKIENKISYVTYQTFPAKTANSLQTISNIKYLTRNGFNVELIFPLRSSDSSNDLKKIKNFYNLDEDITIRGLKHNLPFGKFKYFERLLFLISHFIWSKNTTKTLPKQHPNNSWLIFAQHWAKGLRFSNDLDLSCLQLPAACRHAGHQRCQSRP